MQLIINLKQHIKWTCILQFTRLKAVYSAFSSACLILEFQK